MISRLIDINIKPIEQHKKELKPQLLGVYTITDYANAFLNGLGEVQKMRFKHMLENHIECGMSVALNYGIDYKEFINEVKNQLNVEV